MEGEKERRWETKERRMGVNSRSLMEVLECLLQLCPLLRSFYHHLYLAVDGVIISAYRAIAYVCIYTLEHT